MWHPQRQVLTRSALGTHRWSTRGQELGQESRPPCTQAPDAGLWVGFLHSIVLWSQCTASPPTNETERTMKTRPPFLADETTPIRMSAKTAARIKYGGTTNTGFLSAKLKLHHHSRAFTIVTAITQGLQVVRLTPLKTREGMPASTALLCTPNQAHSW